MQLGTGQAVITPPPGTFLAGYGHRDHGAEGVLDDIEVRVLWFQEDGQGSVCIVTADLIGFEGALLQKLYQDFQERYGLPQERVLLSASHTHSGPQTCSNMLGAGGPVNSPVADMVRQRILEAVEEARKSLRPSAMIAGRGLCEGYAINRRVMQDGVAIMAPNPDGVRDDEVSVIACRDKADGSIRAVLFHFTCHPTLMGDYRITGDYPGAARRYIEKELGGGTVAAFLPGCFGDVRPNCTVIGGKSFRRGMPEDVAAFGSALGGEVVRVVKGEMQPLTPSLGGYMMAAELPIARHPAREELEQVQQTGTAVQKQWAAQLLAAPFKDTRPLSLQRIDLAEEATLIAMGGEICCDYGHFVKRLKPEKLLIPVGYSNGMAGYIPSARLFPEGGYEPDSSAIYFGLPSPFKPEIESVIHRGILELMEQ